MYIIRLASNEIFSPSNKIQREVGRAKDLSAPRYSHKWDVCQYDYAMECKKQQWKESAAEPNENYVFLVKLMT